MVIYYSKEKGKGKRKKEKGGARYLFSFFLLPFSCFSPVYAMNISCMKFR